MVQENINEQGHPVEEEDSMLGEDHQAEEDLSADEEDTMQGETEEEDDIVDKSREPEVISNERVSRGEGDNEVISLEESETEKESVIGELPIEERPVSAEPVIEDEPVADDPGIDKNTAEKKSEIEEKSKTEGLVVEKDTLKKGNYEVESTLLSGNVKGKKNKRKLPFGLSFGMVSIWLVVLIAYLALFYTIGYIAFWEQSFNKPDHVVGPYNEVWEQYLETRADYVASGNVDDTTLKDMDTAYRTLLNDLMKASDDSSSDQQALASQSFNIVLGAFLAFLSATVTMIFQGKLGNKNKNEEAAEK